MSEQERQYVIVTRFMDNPIYGFRTANPDILELDPFIYGENSGTVNLNDVGFIIYIQPCSMKYIHHEVQKIRDQGITFPPVEKEPF